MRYAKQTSGLSCIRDVGSILVKLGWAQGK